MKRASGVLLYASLLPFILSVLVNPQPWFRDTPRNLNNRFVATSVMTLFLLWVIMTVMFRWLGFADVTRQLNTAELTVVYVAAWIAVLVSLNSDRSAKLITSFREATVTEKWVAVVTGLTFYLFVLVSFLAHGGGI